MELQTSDWRSFGVLCGVVVPTALYIGLHFILGSMDSSYGIGLTFFSSLVVVGYQLIISLPISVFLRDSRKEGLHFYFAGGVVTSLVIFLVCDLLVSGSVFPMDLSFLAKIVGMGGIATLIFGLFQHLFRPRAIYEAVEQDAAPQIRPRW